MRHHAKSRRFGRHTSHRLSMFANMATSLFVHERIFTTLEKAKELRRVAERLITLGKRGSLAARRLAASRLRPESKLEGKTLVYTEAALKKLFETIAPRFKDRPGGYTRIVKIGHRQGDNAKMAFIELIPAEAPKTEGKKAPGKKPGAKGGKAPAKKKTAAGSAAAASKKPGAAPAAKKPAAKKPAKKETGE
jgi:large subunit ribosomal protein L17